MEAYFQAAEGCQASPSRDADCDRRLALDAQLKDLGWCWGQENQARADFRWHPCVAEMNRETLRVVRVAPNDILKIREFPTTQSRVVGAIPPNGRHIQYSGDGLGEWVFIRYGRREGWVGGSFVEPDPMR